jgi:hypothetical protein
MLTHPTPDKLETLGFAAMAKAVAEQDRIALRELELKGQVAAERFYHEIQRVAQNNKATRAVSSDMPPGVAFNAMLEWIKDHLFALEFQCTRDRSHQL